MCTYLTSLMTFVAHRARDLLLYKLGQIFRTGYKFQDYTGQQMCLLN